LARAMIAASQDQTLWNSVLHAPTTAPSTQREMVHAFADAAGVTIPEPGLVPTPVLRVVGLVSTQMRELVPMLYQFTGPFVIDSTRSEKLLGLSPTPRDQVVAETVAWYRDR
ncbi:MAG: epimerase, partial [Nocardioidaceae bacterium]|nr:epimerase [Nocardioidaceae bacterium]